MKPVWTETEDGDPRITVPRMEKLIRAADGTMRRLVSFDGERWRMDAAAEKRRIQSATNLHGKTWAKKVEKKFQVANNHGTRYSPPVVLPVEHHGNPFLGKEKGKKHHLRRNLRSQPVKEVRVRLTKVHYHRCHNERYACMCLTAWQRRPCGGEAGCLRKEAISMPKA